MSVTEAVAGDTPEARIVHEPLTYEIGAPVSYFHDLVFAQRGNKPEQERLAQHRREMQALLTERDEAARSTARAEGVELRTNPNRLDGQGGFAAPPLWLMDLIATAPRPSRSLSNRIPGFLLPGGVGEVNVPRLTTGTEVEPSADGGTGVSRDIVDAAATSPVVTFSGQSDVSLQLLEQSPPGAYLDHVIFSDLAADYDFKLERMLVNGSGTGKEFLGILNIPSGVGLANAVTYTDASPTAAELIPFIAQGVAQVGNSRGLPPEVWLLRTSRRAWIEAAAWPQTGHWFDMDPLDDNAIPATLGPTGNQDAIIACRPSDMLLLESVPRFAVDFESGSGALGVRLQMRGYAAAFTARYPTAVATVTGTGMVVQSGY